MAPREVRFLGPRPALGEDTVAAQITRADVEAFRRSLLSGTAPYNSRSRTPRKKKGMGAADANRHVTTLRRVFAFGVAQGYLRVNPVEHVRVLKERTEPRHRALTEGDIDALCAELRDDVALWVRFLVATGLRQNECNQLRFADIRKDHIVVRASTAKDAETRRVPLTSSAREVLDALDAGDRDPRELLFGEACRRTALRNAWKRAGRGDRTPSAHDFRHTFASRAVSAGLDLEELRRILGHQSVITTQRYIHQYGDYFSRTAAKLEGL